MSPAGVPVFRLAVLASGSGTNLQAVIDKLHGRLAGVGGPVIEVALVISDNPDAQALERAREAGIAAAVFPIDHGGSRVEHDLTMAAAIHRAGAELVVLAGYMWMVSPAFVQEFPFRVINLHPAILPAFPGTTSISDALRYGVKVTGVTVHFVDEGLDTGPVIAQEPVRVNDGDTVESLAARIHEVEHQLLPATIRLIAMGKIRAPLPGTRVVQVDWSSDDSSDT